MGQFLCVGICRKITIGKKNLKMESDQENFVKALGERFDLNLYDSSEDEMELRWDIKRDVLENGLLDFLKAQFESCCNEVEYLDLLETLRSAKTYENIIALAEDKYDEKFQEDYTTEFDIELGFGRSVGVNYAIIIYLLQGKIMMESYHTIFKYFDRMIRLQKGKYPIAGAVKVFIAG